MTTWEQVRDIHMRYPKLTAPQIARVLSCLPNYVRCVAHRQSWELPKGRHVLSEWERQSIIDAIKDGEKQESVCAEFSIHPKTARRIARKAGVAARPGGWQNWPLPRSEHV